MTTRVMRYLATTLMGLALMLPLAAQAKVQMLDRIVAVVNDGVIMNSELNQRVDQVEARLKADNRTLPPMDVVRKQVLDHMVLTRIQLQLAKKAGIQVNDGDLNQALAGIAKQNNMTLKQFANTIRQQGQNWQDFREHIRDEMVISRLQQREVSRRVHVTDRDVDNFLKSEVGRKMFQADFHLAQILIKVPSDATTEQVEKAKAKARSLVTKLHNGASFSELAVANSSGPNALEGGDLGWRPAGQWPTLFANAALKMKKGQIAGPLRSGAGFHILKLVDRRGGAQKMVTQYKVRHVLIKPDQLTSPEQALQEAQKLRHEVVTGKMSFAQAAKRNSDDPGSAEQGGELGWVTPGQMVPKFEQVMEHTKPGTVSPVFQTQYGYHFLEVEATRKTDMTEKYRRLQARNALQKQRYEEALENWLQEQRSEAYVNIRLKGDDSGNS